MHKFIAHR